MTIQKLPKHIAIIMDGNNRYAKSLDLPKGEGHRLGKEALDPVVEHCRRIGIEALTVFAFSSENWQRPKAEVALLMRLLEEAILHHLPKAMKNGVRMRFIGERNHLSHRLQHLMDDAESQTSHFSDLTLVIAISYGGQWDMVNAAKSIAIKVAEGRLDAESIDHETFHNHTQLSDLPPVDLLIRTGGEKRISNFLLWHSAYAELYFTDTLWPAFTPESLDEAIDFYSKRERRFGLTSEQVQTQNSDDKTQSAKSNNNKTPHKDLMQLKHNRAVG